MTRTLERDDYFEFARRDHIPLLMIHFIGRAFVQGVHARELGIDTSFSAYRRMFNGSSVPLGEWNAYKEEVRKLLDRGEEILRISGMQLAYVEAMVRYARSYFGKDLKALSNEEILGIIEGFHGILMKMCGHIQTYFAISDYLPELIEKQLTANKELLAYYSTSPKEKTLVREAKEDILRLCSLIDGDDSLKELFAKDAREVAKGLPAPMLREIHDHNDRFGFINGYYMSVAWHTLDDVIEKIQSFLGNYRDELKKMEDDERKNSEGEKFARGLEPDLQRLIRISRHFAWLAFYADEKILLAFNYFKPVYSELAARNDLTYDEMIESTIDEIHTLGLAEKSVLRSRKENYIFYCDKDCDYVFVGEEGSKIEKKELDKEKSLSQLGEVRGQCAYAGVVSGRAKIVKLRRDFGKMEKGDILVSFNTNPTYVPYLEKASGLVTDEGGMLCHAAIVAREMNLPCVIGTKIATKVFKDGDMIELDAQKGIVRKI